MYEKRIRAFFALWWRSGSSDLLIGLLDENTNTRQFFASYHVS